MDKATIAAVGLYAALNLFILIWLTTATARLRRRHRILIGDGGQPHLVRVMRGHANAIEVVPMMLILLLIAAALGAPQIAIHILGAVFTIGRLVHAAHFIAEQAPRWQRSFGFGVSASALLVAGVGVLAHALWILF